jgi:hypothetical protein
MPLHSVPYSVLLLQRVPSARALVGELILVYLVLLPVVVEYTCKPGYQILLVLVLIVKLHQYRYMRPSEINKFHGKNA